MNFFVESTSQIPQSQWRAGAVLVYWYPALLSQVAVCSMLLIILHPLNVLLINQHVYVPLDLFDARRKSAFSRRIIQNTESSIGGESSQ
jgi:hypothetical protein